MKIMNIPRLKITAAVVLTSAAIAGLYSSRRYMALLHTEKDIVFVPFASLCPRG
jgi:hypothetical protein